MAGMQYSRRHDNEITALHFADLVAYFHEAGATIHQDQFMIIKPPRGFDGVRVPAPSPHGVDLG